MYKVGQKVRCIKSYSGKIENVIGEVIKVSNNLYRVKFVTIEGNTISPTMSSDRLEPTTKLEKVLK